MVEKRSRGGNASSFSPIPKAQNAKGQANAAQNVKPKINSRFKLRKDNPYPVAHFYKNNRLQASEPIVVINNAENKRLLDEFNKKTQTKRHTNISQIPVNVTSHHTALQAALQARNGNGRNARSNANNSEQNSRVASPQANAKILVNAFKDVQRDYKEKREKERQQYGLQSIPQNANGQAQAIKQNNVIPPPLSNDFFTNSINAYNKNQGKTPHDLRKQYFDTLNTTKVNAVLQKKSNNVNPNGLYTIPQNANGQAQAQAQSKAQAARNANQNINNVQTKQARQNNTIKGYRQTSSTPPNATYKSNFLKNMNSQDPYASYRRKTVFHVLKNAGKKIKNHFKKEPGNTRTLGERIKNSLFKKKT
jgi:hypothetical protein